MLHLPLPHITSQTHAKEIKCPHSFSYPFFLPPSPSSSQQEGVLPQTARASLLILLLQRGGPGKEPLHQVDQEADLCEGKKRMKTPIPPTHQSLPQQLNHPLHLLLFLAVVPWEGRKEDLKRHLDELFL